MDPDPDRPRRHGCSYGIVSHFKHNIGPGGESFGFEIKEISKGEAEFSWGGKVEAPSLDHGPGRPQENRGPAKEWIREYAGDRKTVEAQELINAGKRHGFKYDTLLRALKDIGGYSSNRGFPDGKYRWFIPEEEDPFA